MSIIFSKLLHFRTCVPDSLLDRTGITILGDVQKVSLDGEDHVVLVIEDSTFFLILCLKRLLF